MLSCEVPMNQRLSLRFFCIWLLIGLVPNLRAKSYTSTDPEWGIAVTVPKEEQQKRYDFWLESFAKFPPNFPERPPEGLAEERFAPPPPPGVHPRVWTRPSEREQILAKATGTEFGRILMAQFHDQKEKLLRNPKYEQLVAGDLNAAEDRMLVRAVAEDAFRCWLEQDRATGERHAKAFITYIRHCQALFDRDGGIQEMGFAKILNPLIAAEYSGFKQWQGSITSVIDERYLDILYDFLYDFMTQTQRDEARAFIADCTQGAYFDGMGLATTELHNWHMLHAALGTLALAIEGEEGSDPKVLAWTKQCLANYYSHGIYRSGVLHERGGKNLANLWTGIPFSRRSYQGVIPVDLPENLLSIPNTKRLATQYFTQLKNPWGPNMSIFGAWGGGSILSSKWMEEILALKYAYPKDPGVDLIWHMVVGDQYEDLRNIGIDGHGHGIPTKVMLLIMGEPYEEGRSTEEKILSLNLPLDFFCPQRLLAVSRTDYSPDAFHFIFHAQQNDSAHPRYGHGTFLLNAMGRPWIHYPHIPHIDGRVGQDSDPQDYCVVRIDGIGTGHKPVRGRHYIHNAHGSLTTIDNQRSFSIGAMFGEKAKWNPPVEDRLPFRPQTMAEHNPLFAAAEDIPGYADPLVERPVWFTPGFIRKDTTEAYDKQFYDWKRYPVDYAFRTAGLIRGAHPYVLITDDIKKDEQSRDYTWQMVLQPDVVLESVQGRKIILKEAEGDRRLLVLNLSPDPSQSPASVRVEEFPYAGWPDREAARIHGKRLVISKSTDSPDFRFVIYPHRAGDPLPDLEVGPGQAQLIWSEQRDQIEFVPTASGLHHLTLTRNGQALISNQRNVE